MKLVVRTSSVKCRTKLKVTLEDPTGAPLICSPRASKSILSNGSCVPAGDSLSEDTAAGGLAVVVVAGAACLKRCFDNNIIVTKLGAQSFSITIAVCNSQNNDQWLLKN